MAIVCMCVWFFISDDEKKKEVKVRIPRVPTSHGELGLNYKRGDKARWCASLRGGSPGLSPGCCRIREKSLPRELVAFPLPTWGGTRSSSLSEQSPL